MRHMLCRAVLLMCFCVEAWLCTTLKAWRCQAHVMTHMKARIEKRRHDSAGSIDRDAHSRTEGWAADWSRAISSSRFPCAIPRAPLFFSLSDTPAIPLFFTEFNKKHPQYPAHKVCSYFTQFWGCAVKGNALFIGLLFSNTFLWISWVSPGKNSILVLIREGRDTSSFQYNWEHDNSTQIQIKANNWNYNWK